MDDMLWEGSPAWQKVVKKVGVDLCVRKLFLKTFLGISSGNGRHVLGFGAAPGGMSMAHPPLSTKTIQGRGRIKRNLRPRDPCASTPCARGNKQQGEAPW